MPAICSKLKPWIPHLVALAIVGLAAWYVAGHWNEFRVLERLDVWSLAGVTAVVILGLAVGGYMMNLFLRRFGVTMPWPRWFGLYVTMSVGNFVTPMRGGTGMAAVYLKTTHGVSFGRFAMMLLGTYVGVAMVNAVLALVGMGLSYVHSGWFNPAAVGLALIVGIACTVAFFIPNLRETDRRGWRLVVRAVNSWHALVKDRALLARVIPVMVVQSLVHALCFLLIYRVLGFDVPPEGVLTIVAMSVIASLVSITPASLGPFDAVLIAMQTTFGLTVPEASAAVIVFRAVCIGSSLVLAGVFSFSLRVPDVNSTSEH